MDVKPNKGGIIKDSVRNDAPFTGKGLSTNLPNITDELRAASVWATRPTVESKSQR